MKNSNKEIGSNCVVETERLLNKMEFKYEWERNLFGKQRTISFQDGVEDNDPY